MGLKRAPIVLRTADGGWIEWQLTDTEDFAMHRELCGLGEANEPNHIYYADALVCKPDAEARRWEEE